MSRWGLALAAGFVALGVWGCVLLAYLLRPAIMIPNDRGVPVWPVCRLDSTDGRTPRLVYLPVTLDP